MKIFIHKLKSFDGVGSYTNTKRLYTTLSISILLSLISFISVGQTGTFSWDNGTTGNTWAATDVTKSYTISCGTGCTVTVTMTIIDPNNRNCDPDTYTTNPFDTGGGCLPYPGVAQTDNVTGNGNTLDPWDSDCAPFYTQTNGAYGLGYLTFAMNSFTHLEDVIIRFTFSKPVFLDAFTIGDIDGRTLQQDRTQNQTGTPSTLSVYELPGNSYQDEVTVTATGPMGNVGVNYSALGSLLTQVGQTVRNTYDNTALNLTPDDARGTITVNTADAITRLDIAYSNGPDDAAAEQANPTWYSWWVNGGTYTLSDGRTITQPAKGATNGVSDNQAIRISGFTFTACPDFAFTRTNATVCVGNTATIGIVPANGTAPYTYSWTGPNGFTSTSQNPSITNVTAAQGGVYTVTAMDSNGCTGTSTAQVTVNPLPTPSITGTNNLTCTTTTITRTATGGGTYLWSNSLGTAATVNVTAAGTYTVTVTNTNGCTATATTSVTLNNTPPTAGITGTNNLTCTTTSVTRTATGGGTYSWSGGLGTAATVNITTAGTYTVTVTDATNGCTATATTSVTLNNTPPTAGITGTNNLSCTTTTVTRTATGGGTYSWSGGLGTAATVNITTAGTYTVTVTDATNGCTATATTSVTLNNTPPTAGITGTNNLTCTTTTVTRTATGGGTYSWSGGLGTAATVNITTAGTYTVTVTNATNGCTVTATTSVTLNNTPPTAGITGTNNLTCTTTSVTRTATGGGTYSWSGGLGTAATVNITTAGTYTVTVTDAANGCTATATTSVTLNNTPPTAGITGTNNLTCTTTTVTRTATGGGTYSWSGGLGTAATVNITTAGTYTVTVTNATNGCTATATTSVTLNNTPPTAGITGTNNLTCTTTSVTRTATGGGTYSWSGGLGTVATVNITTAGTYTVTVTDAANGCTATATTSVTLNNTPPTAGITGTNNLTCTTTTVTRTATGGGTYSWSGGLGTAVTVNITTAGTYTVTVTDATTGCTATATTSVTTGGITGITAQPSLCSPATNTYSVSGSVSFTNPPTTGTLTISIGSQSVVFNAPFTSPISYTIPNLTSDGASHTVSADFSASSCPVTTTYIAPVNCACPTTTYPICAGESYTLTAQSGLTSYQWYLINGTDTTAIAGATSQTYIATTVGKYIWKGTDAAVCSIALCCPVNLVPGLCYGSIGDYVWSDVNNNGQQDGTETPLAGVKVYLLNASGMKIDSTVTDATGKYLFDSLTIGNYRVQFVAPAGTIASKQNVGADGTDSDANKLGLSQLISIDTSKLPTDSLRNNLNIDAGFVPVGSIGDYVFNDKDGDGIQDPTDAPLSGIKVYLVDANTGAKLDSTVTGVNGLYKFDSLLSGSYKVQFVIPVGSEASPKTAGGDPTKDSNINPDGTTDTVVIDATKPLGDPLRDNTTVDAGIKPAYGSIGDYVWSDVNNNGQQDGTETPLAGVKVYLLNASGVKIDSTVTDATGKYLFDSLTTGSYRVQFVAPAGTIASKQNVGADGTDSDANKLGLSQLISIDTSKLPTDSLRNNLNIDAGFVPVGSIGDYVFNDKDGDGIQDPTDAPLSGIKVYLVDATTGAKLDSTVTGVNGLYKFDSLLSGSYKVQFVIPVGSEASPKTAGGDPTKDSNINPDGTTDTVVIDATKPLGDPLRDNTTVDAGIKPAYGSIGDYVWSDVNNNGQQDGTETPLSGVKVYLLNASGVKIDSTVTDATGKYLFDSLTTGSYRVQFVAPTGTIASKQNVGADGTDSDANKLGLSQLISIDTSKLPTDSLRNNLNIDAGFVPVGSIGDYVFNDKDGDGIQDPTDAPLSGIKVYLVDATTGAKLDSTVTGVNGLYKFDSLLSGSYKVQFVIPVGSEASPKTAGGDPTKDSNINPDGTTDTVVIDATKPLGDPLRDNTTVDAGIKPAYGSIGDYVWSDVNNNGQQDGTETPLSGVKVYLLNASGVKIDSTVTDATGKYLFDSLTTGSYRVQFVAPTGTIASKQNVGADGTDSDANKLGLSQLISIDTSKLPTDSLRNNLNIDAGFVPVGSIGDYVFNDKDGDGIQDPTDAPLSGIKVYLVDATTGAKLDSTVTGVNGLYKFDSLLSGSYKVQFVIPVGSEASPKTAGGDPTKDSNINPDGTTDTVVIDATKPLGDPLRDNTTVDAGIKPAYGSIGDYVWSDVNNNGQQDGTETPLAGVKVYLLNASGVKIDSTVTDATGKYLFDSLTTGSYRVQFVAPAGTIASKQNVGADGTDSDANKLGLSQLISIDTSKLPTDSLRNNLNIDAGFVPVGSIGDYVFNDKDGDGIQDPTDAPLSGIKVYLVDANTGAKLDSTVTGVNGLYKFDSLLSGSYKVQFVIPVGSEASPKTAGGDPTKDSNINPDGTTDTIVIDATKPLGDPLRDNTTVDAGIKPAYGSIGDYVWSDVNNNGQQDGTETPLSGVKVYLLNASGVKIDSTVTDATGRYLFDSLTTGSYRVQFVAPTGTIASKQNVGADGTDSDANKLGLSQLISIDTSKLPTDSLRNNLNIDAGFVPVGSIGDYVFNDKDGDGIQDPTDAPLAGIKVYLIDATTGTKLDSTVTGVNGFYKFDSLLSGSYKVQFVIPVGSEASPKTAGGDPTKDSNINPDGTTDTVVIDATKPLGDPLRDNTTVDAGIKPAYGSIGDYVWSDVNNNGQQDGTETPLAGVKVYLLNASGVKIDSTVTDATGKYLFDSLTTGSYRVQFVAPTGTIASKQNVGADGTDSDANKLGLSQLISIDTSKLPTDSLRNNLNIDAGFVPVGSIGDYVFEDKDKSNTQTAGDTPLAGVKVYLLDATTGAKLDSTTSDINGLYVFDSLVAGNYKVQFVAPSGTLLADKATGTDTTKDSNPDPLTGITDTIILDTTKPIGDPARDNKTIDAGIQLIPAFGSIGDYVWTDKNNNGQQDSGEAPIAGVKVYLYDATGTTKLDSTLTDGAGKYLFDSLLTGNYLVKFVAPLGTIAAKQNTGADVTDSDANNLGWSQLISIDVTKAETDTLRNNTQIDAGFVPVGSIGDYVFQDKDNSNTQTTGDVPVEGVKVYLLDATTGAKLDSTITDGNGLYKFDSLVAGSYKVQVVIPTGLLPATKDTGTDDTKDSDINPTGITDTVTIDTTKPIGDPARDNTSVDAGLQGIPQYGSIGDYVWSDANNDGQQGVGEDPIAGVKVYLYDGTGTIKLDSAITDGTGKYLFDSLLTGTYKVKFATPAGTVPTSQNTGSDVTDSDINDLGWSQLISIDVTKPTTDTLRNNTQIDAGFVPFGSIGDYVFEDKDNSNTQTAGDQPIACIKVYLLDAITGAILDSTMTDASGKYLFDSLLAGSYKIQFEAPIGGTFVTKTSGTDTTKDSNPDATGLTDSIVIDTTKPLGDPARDNTSVDAGMKLVGPFGSIGDYVWLDTNNNGQQDSGEAPIAGVKVYLYDGTGSVIMDSTVTDATGKYLFDSLFTASYKVKFVAPVGTIVAKQNTGADVSDSDISKTGWSQVINIDVTKAETDTLRNNLQIDAGFVPVGSIGDYVFQDKDESNTQTAGDLPVQGVKVYLLNASGVKIDSTITDGNGLYKFDSLLAGTYKVQFVAPDGTNIVSKNAGTDTTKDSNPDPLTGITDSIVLNTNAPVGDPTRDITQVDAGIKGQLQYGSIGDYVWTDSDNDGQQDSGEAPIAGVKVLLYDATGTILLDSTTTDGLGKYLFDSLLTGDYRVKFIAPAGMIAAKANTGSDVTDSDANALGLSPIISIDVTKAETDILRNNPQIDAGFVPVGSIGDYVFADNDKSNTQTVGDTPVAGVKVYLLDAVTGAKLDSTVTNINGLYKFDSLLAGNYKVQFEAPVGTVLVTKDSGTDDTKDSDADTTGTTGIVTVDTTKPVGDATRDITSVDAGLNYKVDLKLTKIATGDCKRKAGDVVSFKITVKRQDLIVTDVAATVKDSLSANFEFVSATATEGTYSNTTGIWSGISLAKGDSAVLTLNARIKQGATGLVCNDAWIQTMDKDDFDSIAGNKVETEDDFARACVSVPLPVCTARGEKAELTAPAGYTSYQWFKNGQAITGATSRTYLATTFGEYTVTVNNGSCPSTGCCPIYVDEFCDCPPTICVPFVIQKTKSKK